MKQIAIATHELTASDQRWLHAMGVQSDTPLLMTEADWSKLCGQLRADLEASERDLAGLADLYEAMGKAYERLDAEAGQVHRECNRLLEENEGIRLWRSTLVVFLVLIVVTRWLVG